MSNPDDAGDADSAVGMDAVGGLAVGGVHTAQLRGRRDVVHVLVDWTFRPLANGRQTSMTMHHYWQLRADKVAVFRGSEDGALTAEAFAG